MRKLICYIFGHDWKFNFSTMPSKAICTKCNCKAKFNLRELIWESVSSFENETRTDKELKSKWVREKVY